MPPLGRGRRAASLRQSHRSASCGRSPPRADSEAGSIAFSDRKTVAFAREMRRTRGRGHVVDAIVVGVIPRGRRADRGFAKAVVEERLRGRREAGVAGPAGRRRDAGRLRAQRRARRDDEGRQQRARRGPPAQSRRYHILQRSAAGRTIAACIGQGHAAANSGMLATVPFTRFLRSDGDRRSPSAAELVALVRGPHLGEPQEEALMPA